MSQHKGVLLILPLELHRRIKVLCAESGVTIRAFLLEVIQKEVEKIKK